MISTPISSRRSCSRKKGRSRILMQTLTPREEGGNPVIEVRNLSKVYGGHDGPVQALSDLSFAVADQEFVTIVGHSGCGKTTLLKIVAGLLSPSSGSVAVRGRAVQAPLADVGMVFQRPVLLN